MVKIWIVGRYNVGKSTLFNVLIWSHKNIVTDVKWTTKEIIWEEYIINNKVAYIYDSIWIEEDTNISEIIEFLKKLDLILFVVDWKQWLTKLDYEISSLIYKLNKKKHTILVINKLDNDEMIEEYFYELGFETIWISAKHKLNIEYLEKKIFEKISELNLKLEKYTEWIPVVIIWRPNTGKSTLLNKIANDSVSKVSPVPWTTLDYIKIKKEINWDIYEIYDTVWLRRKWKIRFLEKIAYNKVLKLLEFKKPVTIVLIDALEPFTHRDLTIIWDLIRLKHPLIVAINKIDIVKPKIQKIDFATWIPVIHISWKTWENVENIFPLVKKVYQEYWKNIKTSLLNEVIENAYISKPPTFLKNKSVKIYYWTQIQNKPPTFLFFVNNIKNINFSFKRWLENVIRERFWFIWTPLIFEFKEKN